MVGAALLSLLGPARPGRRSAVLAALLTLLVPATLAAANSQDESRRILLGLNFFPNVLSVDEGILDKRTPEGLLRVLLLYRELPEAAQRLAAALRREAATIKKVPVEVVVEASAAQAFAGPSRPCGIFLTEYLPDAQFRAVLRLAAENRVIVFSPFEGDMERGATAGLSISSKIRPALNTTTLERSRISIHEMFVRLSKLYD